MKRGTVPINYIVAITLGLLVVGLLTYFFIYSYKEGGQQLSYNECYAKFISYCAIHGNANGFKDQYPGCKDYSFGDCPTIIHH